MKNPAYHEFVRKTERLAKPRDVTAISFLGDFNKILPLSLQEKIMADGGSKIPYMGFIVDPYCCFLAYRITDLAAAAALLPDNYDIAEVRVFRDQEPCPLVIIGGFSVRTSAFIGNRLEFYLSARRRDTGAVSWIIADYESNTNSYDPKNGFCGYTADPAVLTTTPHGELLLDFKGTKTGRELTLTADLEKGRWRELDPELWVLGNLSIDYGRDLGRGKSQPFSLIFDPYLMHKALEIPVEAVNLQVNTYLSHLLDPGQILCAAVFPYSQHFVIKQDLPDGAVKTPQDLVAGVQDFVRAEGYKTMAGDDIKKPLLRGMLVSTLVTWGVILALALKVALG